MHIIYGTTTPISSPPAWDATPPRPRCKRCGAQGQELTEFVTGEANENGNAGRPYLKCVPCDDFTTFTDCRGIHRNNPICDCGLLTRLQAAGEKKGRGLHYTCCIGSCRYYEIKVDHRGEQVTLSGEFVGLVTSSTVFEDVGTNGSARWVPATSCATGRNGGGLLESSRYCHSEIYSYDCAPTAM